jgi:hypothetical protein
LAVKTKRAASHPWYPFGEACGPMSVRDMARARIPLDVRHRVAQLRVSVRIPTARWRGLPEVLVIGAQRSGTSTLYRHLGSHPDLAPSIRKEVEYFSRRYARDVDWYRAHFELEWGRRRVSFEATPDYLFHPLAAERAAALVPEARLVVMLRDPTARAWSHYLHMVSLGHEALDFEAALAAEDARCAADLDRLAADPLHDPVALLRYSYVSRGRYAEQLARWYAHFPRDRVLVIRSEDFFTDTAAAFGRIVGFIGVRDWQPDRFVNVSRQGRPAPPPLAEQTRRRLAATFAEPNRQLATLLAEPAPVWWFQPQVGDQR